MSFEAKEAVMDIMRITMIIPSDYELGLIEKEVNFLWQEGKNKNELEKIEELENRDKISTKIIDNLRKLGVKAEDKKIEIEDIKEANEFITKFSNITGIEEEKIREKKYFGELKERIEEIYYEGLYGGEEDE